MLHPRGREGESHTPPYPHPWTQRSQGSTSVTCYGSCQNVHAHTSSVVNPRGYTHKMPQASSVWKRGIVLPLYRTVTVTFLRHDYYSIDVKTTSCAVYLVSNQLCIVARACKQNKYYHHKNNHRHYHRYLCHPPICMQHELQRLTQSLIINIPWNKNKPTEKTKKNKNKIKDTY